MILVKVKCPATNRAEIKVIARMNIFKSVGVGVLVAIRLANLVLLNININITNIVW